ncbi:MetQ/NlpA family ABC transporter substrate-binding protein [Brachybacterium sp. J144]|uniref:MetQ/NlpA family ABC transporter substrate-binding protein n=1 Tax=Brachybacterium sp. J144 TaxID=3116487 RepID=UPI002E7818F3|nr:MetQ/NlpA family ABC transporter substrate-binding protein [Brachybacterium sp. J144]MEE1650053.1 MetQ/NlpA family ABC transporter substrate-binding protein [Brachybacterium sp. J144]
MAPITRRTTLLASGAGLAALALAACGAGGSEGPTEEDGVTTIRIGASPAPHAQILTFVKDNLAADAGLALEITEYTDYQIPNQALADGDIDANFYQTPAFLEGQMEEKGFDFFAFEGVHVEPLGVYSETLTSLDELEDGAEVAIANDPTNRGRGLDLLAANGLITLADGVAPTSATTGDIAENPKNLQFTELEAAQIPRSLGDFAIAVINGNYALEAGLNPAEEALVIEAGEGNPNANMMVVRSADAENEALVALDGLLHSDEVRSFIEETYTDGSVIPAF